MSYIKEASKGAETNCVPQQEKGSLLSKYEIPITHFEFDYIEKCKDGKELEKILLILRSGEEGYYPDLETATENRLRIIKPKCKLLRTTTQVLNKHDLEKHEIDALSSEINIWVDEITKDDKELDTKKTTKIKTNIAIRTHKEIGIPSHHPKEKKEKRIASTDFEAWDKFDPDTEIQKMELEETKEKQKMNDKKACKPKEPSQVNHDKFSSDAERKFAANHEREKGNEFFKNGEYENAIICYTNSITYKPSEKNLNNRALTYLKLLKYSEAIADCQKVLSFNNNNLKAHLHLAEAFEKTENYKKALKHIEFLIQQEPNNCYAQSLAERIRKNCTPKFKKVQMQITEIN